MMVTVHGFSHLEKASNRGSRLQFPIYYLFAKLIVRKFDHIITVTSRLRDYTISKLGSTSEKVSVVYNGVDADKFEPSIKGDIIREKYCIKDNEFVLIFAKAMIPQNGPQFLLKAMPRILDKHPNVRLIMAGDGPLREKLIQFAKKENFLEKIVFPGVVPHDLMRYFLAASDAVVIPSVSSSDQEEGMPNIMLEGMAMGKAIIASEIGGMKEIIDNRGIGILVPDKDDLSIAKAVFQLIQNPIYCSVLGEIAREYVTQNMTWARIADTTVAIYEGLNTSPPMMP
jgi:glycosyltransferase involved in cell wall biosynthesis